MLLVLSVTVFISVDFKEIVRKWCCWCWSLGRQMNSLSESGDDGGGAGVRVLAGMTMEPCENCHILSTVQTKEITATHLSSPCSVPCWTRSRTLSRAS